MIKLKTPEQISLMNHAGSIAGQVLVEVSREAQPGKTTRELDTFIDTRIKELGGESAFKKVEGYTYATCFSVNDEVVHGLPTDYILKDGDVVGIDLGAVYKDYFSDTATTVLVGTKHDPAVVRFLATGKAALEKAISQAKIGNHIGDVSACIQEAIEGAGYSVVKELTGHGIGTYLHEDPAVPGRGKAGSGPRIEEGLVIAIEVIYNMGKPGVSLLDDGWTIVSSDESISGLFEHTIAVTKKGPVVLTNP